MTQLRALTLDSGRLPGDPMLGEGGGGRQARWDVITPCNLQEMQGAARRGDESARLLLLPELRYSQNP